MGILPFNNLNNVPRDLSEGECSIKYDILFFLFYVKHVCLCLKHTSFKFYLKYIYKICKFYYQREMIIYNDNVIFIRGEHKSV